MNKKIIFCILGIACLSFSIIYFSIIEKDTRGCEVNTEEQELCDENGENCHPDTYTTTTCDEFIHNRYIIGDFIFTATIFLSGIIFLTAGVAIEKKEKNIYE